MAGPSFLWGCVRASAAARGVPHNADNRASTVHSTHRTETPPPTTAPGGGSAGQPGGWDEVSLRGEPRPAPQGHLPHLSQPHHLTRRTDEAGTAEMNPRTTRLRTSAGPHHPAPSHRGEASTLPDPRGEPQGPPVLRRRPCQPRVHYRTPQALGREGKKTPRHPSPEGDSARGEDALRRTWGGPASPGTPRQQGRRLPHCTTVGVGKDPPHPRAPGDGENFDPLPADGMGHRR